MRKSLKIFLFFIIMFDTFLYCSIAEEIRSQNPEIIKKIASSFIVPASNFVERPWAGTMMSSYKNRDLKKKIGEAFEISAYPILKDKEAGENPSVIIFSDGSSMTLLELLEYAGEQIAGSSFIERHGTVIPILPKTLNIGQLLSLQAHPKGNIETYIIIATDEKATIRLGFKNNCSADGIKDKASQGRAYQEELLKYLIPNTQERFYEAIRRHLANRQESVDFLYSTAKNYILSSAEPIIIKNILSNLKETYWSMLDLLNEIPVSAGQVIHNATPARFLQNQEVPSAEIHALGNEQEKEILALEIRRPGITYRLWDNVRFPLRAIDIEASLNSLNLQATSAQDFIVMSTFKQPGIEELVKSDAYSIERWTIAPNKSLSHNNNALHLLFIIKGSVQISSKNELISLKAGQTVLVPIGVSNYNCISQDPETIIIKVDFPL